MKKRMINRQKVKNESSVEKKRMTPYHLDVLISDSPERIQSSLWENNSLSVWAEDLTVTVVSGGLNTTCCGTERSYHDFGACFSLRLGA